MQKVYLSCTQSGEVGLFTNGILAWPLDSAERIRFVADPAGFCKALGFEYLPLPARFLPA